jgi:integrase/recombinase XerD
MTLLAPSLQAWFTDRLITQRNSSPQTIAAYRDTFRLLLRFAREQTGKQPFELDIDDLDAPLIGAFLKHLEEDRANSPRTRNARLGAIHSFYRFAALEHPEHAATIARVMAIPTKRHERTTVSYLDLPEIKALLAAPDRSTWLGRRDHALLLLMIQTGVRVSELVGLRVGDVQLGTAPHCRVTGKGRKKRATTLTRETVAVLRPWLKERKGDPEDPLFPTRQGRPLSRYTVGALLSKHATTAAGNCPSLTAKRVTPHALRHTNAMLLRAKDVDIATIALWLGHESSETTRIYEHADPAPKEKAIARTASLGAKPGRYRPSDTLLAFLEAL